MWVFVVQLLTSLGILAAIGILWWVFLWFWEKH